jgi:hypothetical protein
MKLFPVNSQKVGLGFYVLLMLFVVSACNLGTMNPDTLQDEQGSQISNSPDSSETSIPTTDIPVMTPSITETSTRPPTRTPEPTPTDIPTRTALPFASGPTQIGTSVGGRPLDVYRFGNGPEKFMIVAGIHGGYEWNTIKLANQLIEYITEHPEFIPPETTLYIMPALNPDGEARIHGSGGRANDNGVDLNRNFPTRWKADWNRSGCWQLEPISAGDYALSEPESKSLAEFLLAHPINALISYHSAGMGIYPGGHAAHQPSVDLARTLAAASTFPYPPFDTGCEVTGMLVDYAAELGIAAVDLELSTHWDTELPTNLAMLPVFLNWRWVDQP